LAAIGELADTPVAVGVERVRFHWNLEKGDLPLWGTGPASGRQAQREPVRIEGKD
jgi:hypothetical protein